MDSNIKTMLNSFNDNVFDLLNYIVSDENTKYNINSKIILKDFDENCNSYTENNTIYLKKSLLLNIDFSNNIKKYNNIYYVIKNIYHELAHMRQIHDAEKNIINDGSMLYIATYLINKYNDKDYYLRNYNYQFIEILAEEYAYNSVLNLLSDNSILKNNINDMINNINLHKEIIYRIDAYGNAISVFNYFPDIIKSIIQNNVNLLIEFPLLLNFFDNNGKFKNINKILENDNFIDVYNMCPRFIRYLYFNEIFTAQLDEKFCIKYLNILKCFVEDYINSFSYLLNCRLVSVKSVNFSIQYYEKNAKIVLDKINIALNNKYLQDNFIFYKNKLYELLSLMEK